MPLKGLGDVGPDSLLTFRGDDFEGLCGHVLRHEIRVRHPEGSVDGPPPQYVKDGGVDLLVTIRNIPSIVRGAFAYALTADALVETCCSCKTGGGIRGALLDDARTKEGPLKILRAGGRLSAFVHAGMPPLVKRQIRVEIANRLGLRLDGVRPSDVEKTIEASTPEKEDEPLLPGAPSKIEDRIEIFDANDIAAFIREHRPVMTESIRTQLGLRDPVGILGMQTWMSLHREQRAWPSFQTDADRTAGVDAIRDGLVSSRQNPVLWVHGPPGTGKSRTVIEAINLSGFDGRALCAPSMEVALAAMEAIRCTSDVILVVDDVEDEHVGRLVESFRFAVDKPRPATLVVVGPPRGPDVASPRQVIDIPLVPLGREASRRLLLDERVSPEEVDRLLAITGGNPWFMVIVARELAKSEEHRVPVTPWEAAAVAIAGAIPLSGAEYQAWQERVDLRARAVLAITALPEMTWGDAQEQYGTAKLSEAFGGQWDRLVEAAEKCYSRGLVVTESWVSKYVTPAILVRIIAQRYLSAPYDLGRRIVRMLPDCARGFVRRLEQAQAQPDLVELIRDAL